MNKTNYKNTFSQIHPSDETVERILDMTNKKQTISFKKAFAVVLVIALIICSVGIMADATTDGAVTEKISEVADNVSKKIRVLVNGKEADNFEIVTEKDEDGKTHFKANIDLPEGYASVEGVDEALNETVGSVIEFELESSGSDGEDYVFSGEGYDVVIPGGAEAYEPTTVAASE